jgi:hypothetical protein
LLSQIFQRVSILEESKRNCKTFSAFRVLSVALIISTDSLNHSAIFILCPAIPSQRRTLDSFSASASFTCIIFLASHSLNAASLSFSVSTILFIADITVFSSFTSLTCIESSL